MLWWFAWPAQAYNYAGTYTFAARWNELGASTSGGITTYPEEHLGLNEFDVCPAKQVSLMVPGAVVTGNIKQTCANLWIALLESSQTLGSATTLTRAKDLSEDWDINFIDPSDSSHNYWFDWYNNQYISASLWGNPTVTRTGYPLTLSGGPHSGESILGNGQILALGDDNMLFLDADGSISIYNYPGGSLQSNPTATTLSNGTWNGQTLASKLRYLVGYEEGHLYFVEGASTLHVYNTSLVWQRTQTVVLGHELSAYTLGELVDNQIPGYTYIGWDVGPIVIGVSALRPLDHLEVTTASSSAASDTPISVTIKACANSSCSTLYTRGVSGTLTLSDGSTAAFSIASGSSTTTINLTVAVTPAGGHVTVGHSGLSVTPIGTPSLWCGFGVAASSSASCNLGIFAPFHHLEITTSSSTGLSCTPSTFTLTACANAACTTTYTGGLSGQFTLSGSGATVQPASPIAFTMGAGTSSQNISAQVTAVPASGDVSLGATGLSPAPTGTPGLYCGLGSAASGTGSCLFRVSTAGLLMSVPHHRAEATTTLTVTAVRQDTGTAACVPAFASVSKTLALSCAYVNPAAGTRSVRVQGTALNASANPTAACGATAPIALAFDHTGTATASLQYADVGQMALSGTYTGSGTDAGLVMTGSTTFVAAPAALSINTISSPPLTAGSLFSAALQAVNDAGEPVPNFGRESPASSDYVRVGWGVARPVGPSASAGLFSGTGTSSATPLASSAFSQGAVVLGNLIWSEVGQGDLSASLLNGNYLSSGMGVSGSTGSGGAVGPFQPHHIDLSLTPGCGASFTYSGQPFTVTVTARNAAGATTLNYDGSVGTTPNHARTVYLSTTSHGGTGTLSGWTIASGSFVSGTATSLQTPTFTFTNKLTAPTTVGLRATDDDGVSSAASGTEPSLALRSGRLQIFNAYGSDKSSLQIPVQAQYWSGNTWILNPSDSCTAWSASSVALSDYSDARGQITSGWSTTPSAVSIVNGHGTLTLSPPSHAGNGSVALAINLGNTSADQSCLATHPISTGARLSWLRSAQGSSNACAGLTAYDRDPSARATFGVYTPESRKVIHVRELF